MILEMKLCILLGALFLIAPATSHSQAKYQVDRKASFRLKKDELRPVSLLMDSGMSAKIYIESNALLSFTVYNPAGEVLYADMTLSSSINWQFGAKMDGLYKIDFQNSSRFLANRVHYELIFEKYKGIKPRAETDRQISKEKQEVLLDASYQTSRKAPKTYPFVLEEGDQLMISLSPKGSQTSYVEVSNDQGELIHGQFPSATKTKVSLPIYTPGTYSISTYWNKYWRGKESVLIEKWSPARYAPMVDTSSKKIVQYDTISTVFLDTSVFLGALRDIVHSETYIQDIIFPSEDSTIFWGILYGYGSSFSEELKKMKTMLEGEAAAAGIQDVISGHYAKYITRMPSPGGARVKVEATERIEKALKKSRNGNFAWIDSTDGYFQIIFENTSESSGQLVYLMIVQFRHVSK